MHSVALAVDDSPSSSSSLPPLIYKDFEWVCVNLSFKVISPGFSPPSCSGPSADMGHAIPPRSCVKLGVKGEKVTAVVSSTRIVHHYLSALLTCKLAVLFWASLCAFMRAYAVTQTRMYNVCVSLG